MHLYQANLADVVVRQASTLVDEAGLPLRRVLAYNGADLAVGNAERLG